MHTVKGFGIVKKAEIDVFLELSCFFDDPANVGNLISGSSAFSKTNLNIWKFTVHILLKTGLEKFEHYITSVWDECNCAVVWASFSIAFLWDWNENWPFPVLWPLQRLGYIKTMTSILFSPPAPQLWGKQAARYHVVNNLWWQKPLANRQQGTEPSRNHGIEPEHRFSSPVKI